MTDGPHGSAGESERVAACPECDRAGSDVYERATVGLCVFGVVVAAGVIVG